MARTAPGPLGLRRSTLPSLGILLVCWSVAPFVNYWPLLALAGLADLFMVPTFSIVRQALIAAVPGELRKTALALDSVFVEITFMVGPALGVVLATYWSTVWALLVCQLAVVAAGALIWLMNPALRKADPRPDAVAQPEHKHNVGIGTWISPPVLAVFGVCFAATVVLSGTDVGVVAALRHMGSQPAISWD